MRYYNKMQRQQDEKVSRFRLHNAILQLPIIVTQSQRLRDLDCTMRYYNLLLAFRLQTGIFNLDCTVRYYNF